VDDGPARVELVRSVQQPEASHRDTDRRVGERPAESLERTRLDHSVRVEEHEHVPGRLGRAPVAAAGEAEILVRLDQAHPRVRFPAHDLRVAPAVVDHDHLHLGRERTKAARQRLARLVGDDDDREAQ
jgi:hypothetical protein